PRGLRPGNHLAADACRRQPPLARRPRNGCTWHPGGVLGPGAAKPCPADRARSWRNLLGISTGRGGRIVVRIIRLAASICNQRAVYSRFLRGVVRVGVDWAFTWVGDDNSRQPSGGTEQNNAARCNVPRRRG